MPIIPEKIKRRFCDPVLDFLGRLRFLPPLVARVSVGWVFVESGWGKLHNLSKVVEFFRELHIPAPEIQAPFVAGTELIGGLLVMLGLLTRVASVPLIGTMIVAILTAKMDEIAGLSDLFGMQEYLFIILFLYLVIEGPGKISIDHLLCRECATTKAKK